MLEKRGGGGEFWNEQKAKGRRKPWIFFKKRNFGSAQEMIKIMLLATYPFDFDETHRL